jgi:hypothetical protein
MATAAYEDWIKRARSTRIEHEARRRRWNLKRDGGSELVGPCPKCGGTDRFSINITKQLWNCRGCGKGGDIIDLIQHVDGCEFVDACEAINREPPPKANGKNSAAEPRKVVVAQFEYHGFAVERIEYRNPDGSPVLTRDGKPKKTFRQKRPDPDRPGEWIYNVDGVPVVPYRLPELIEAIANGYRVAIVEGEAKVDLLRTWNIAATCCAGGSKGWQPEHAQFLAGADVVIMPDNDPAGRSYLEDVANSLRDVATSIRTLELPGLPPKGDIIDWAAAGGTVERLHELIEREAKPWAPGATTPAPTPTTIAEVEKVFQKWLALDDLFPVYATLGTIAANHLPGDPVWLGLIAPPSTAKTEILNSLLRLPRVLSAATLTPAALLSGTPKKQMDIGARGGLLRRIGDFGLLVLKDFGSILSMRQEAKAELLAALREIFDGAWTRHLGTDGGKCLEWKGKVGLIFGATEVYDSHYSVIGSLGDRFLLCRIEASSSDEQFDMAIQHVGAKTSAMRTELAEAVAGLFVKPLPEPQPLAPDEAKWLKKVVGLIVRLRGAVERDRYSRDIEAVYGAEGPGRVALTLERLLAGMTVLGVPRQTALQVIKAVALASTPPIRKRAFEALSENISTTTRDLAMKLALPTSTTRRALEDLAAHKLAVRRKAERSEDQGQLDGLSQSKSKGGQDLWRRTVPVIPDPPPPPAS